MVRRQLRRRCHFPPSLRRAPRIPRGLAHAAGTAASKPATQLAAAPGCLLAPTSLSIVPTLSDRGSSFQYERRNPYVSSPHLKLARRQPRSALPIAPLPSISEIPFSRLKPARLPIRSPLPSQYYLLSWKSDFLGSCFPNSKYLRELRVLRGQIEIYFGEAAENQHASRVRSPNRKIC